MSTSASSEAEPLLHTPMATEKTARRLSSYHSVRRPARPVMTPGGVQIQMNSMTPVQRLFDSTAETPSRIKDFPSRVGGITPARRLSMAAPPRLTDEQVAEMYRTTLELSQADKINSKNSWSLHLIDYMDKLIMPGDDPGAETSNQDTNFQIAGVALDAGVRIYSSRVDSVHTNAFKVLGALSRNSSAKPASHRSAGNGYDSDGDGDEATPSEPSRLKKRAARRAGGNTLLPQDACQHVAKPQAQVDPLFQKMSVEESGPKGLLLNLSINDSCELIFDSCEPVMHVDNVGSGTVASGESSLPQVCDLTKFIPAMSPAECLDLCPRFMEFYRSIATAESVELRAPRAYDRSALAANTSSEIQLPHVLSENNGAFSYIESEAYPGCNNSDDWSDQCDDEAGYRPEDVTDDTAGAKLMSGGLDMWDIGLPLARNSDYCFFDASAMQGWSGPQHWQFRAAGASSHSKTSTSVSARATKNIVLDFSPDAPDISAEFVQSTKPTSNQLSQTVREGFSEKKVTLPVDLQYKTEKLLSLFLKPRFVFSKSRSEQEPRAESFSVSGEEQCSPLHGLSGELDPCADEVGFEQSAMNTFDGSTENGEALAVDKDIGFATFQKKVDMKELKGDIWGEIEGLTAACTVSEVRSDGSKSYDSSTSHGDRSTQSTTLQQLVQTLLPKLDQSVSLPYIFISLLHLANEKTLDITSAAEGPLTDLIISKDHRWPM